MTSPKPTYDEDSTPYNRKLKKLVADILSHCSCGIVFYDFESFLLLGDGMTDSDSAWKLIPCQSNDLRTVLFLL